jgi:hypothetical protein
VADYATTFSLRAVAIANPAYSSGPTNKNPRQFPAGGFVLTEPS